MDEITITKQLKSCTAQRCIGYQNNGGVISTVYRCLCEWEDGSKSNAYLVQGPPRWDEVSRLHDYEGISIVCYAERPRIDMTSHVISLSAPGN